MTQIPETESGLVRLYALNMDPAQARFLRDTPGGATQALGLPKADESLIEIFPLRDLGPIGLAGYLTEGCGIDPASLAADRDRLDALTGWVLVLPSQAIPDRPATLSPQDGVTLIGTYAEPRTNWQATPQATPDSARPRVTSPRAARARARRIGGTIFALTMFLLAAIAYALAT